MRRCLSCLDGEDGWGGAGVGVVGWRWEEDNVLKGQECICTPITDPRTAQIHRQYVHHLAELASLRKCPDGYGDRDLPEKLGVNLKTGSRWERVLSVA